METSIFGTLCIVLSGFLLYLDKIFSYLDITVDNLHGWSDQENYIWSLCQTLSPILIIIGSKFRAYTVSYLIPIFCYVLQFYFVLDSSMTVDKPMTWVYVAGTSALLVFVVWTIQQLLNTIRDRRNIKIDLMEEIIKTDDLIIRGGKNEKK